MAQAIKFKKLAFHSLTPEQLAIVPDWFKEAKHANAVISCDETAPGCGFVWHNGLWLDGTWKWGVWEKGVWINGQWHQGTWLDGYWTDGIWWIGIWKGGVWKGGIWKYGTWCGGTWDGGIWRGGIWKNGIWKGGTWKMGYWEGGIWEGGEQRGSRAKWCIEECGGGNIWIGCKEKTREEWDAFFSDECAETYTTPRDSEQFKQLKDQWEWFKANKL